MATDSAVSALLVATTFTVLAHRCHANQNVNITIIALPVVTTVTALSVVTITTQYTSVYSNVTVLSLSSLLQCIQFTSLTH